MAERIIRYGKQVLSDLLKIFFSGVINIIIPVKPKINPTNFRKLNGSFCLKKKAIKKVNNGIVPIKVEATKLST